MFKQRLFSLPQFIFVLTSWLALGAQELNAFSPTFPGSQLNYKYDRIDHLRQNFAQLNLSAKSQSSSLPKASEMKATELRKELQSYGISTKSFFEKSELVEAVEKARAEGKTPSKSSSDESSEGKGDSNSKSSSSSSRLERLAKEMEKCSQMKVGELKKELESFGIGTKSFFEKSEFVRAVAEARVDGVKSTNNSTKSREEEYDPSYRDVQMQKMDGRMLGMSPVIDVRLG